MRKPVLEQAADLGENASDENRVGLRAAARLFARYQPVTASMLVLGLIIPLYLVIGSTLMRGRTVHAPALGLDRAFPVEPAWSVVYLSLFLAALLPVFVVHQQALVRRVVLAYLAVWLGAYVVFLAYPTICPRPSDAVIGGDFSAWLLRAIYSSDIRYNCLPSLHVGQATLAALVCFHVHRGVGAVAGVWACLLAMSTLYTKQHYVLDVIAGALLAYVAYGVFVRSHAREATPEFERRLAPHLAVGAVGTYGLMVAIMWLAYSNGVVV